jgi:predicted phage terminase large subunit-like protein
VTQSFSLTPKQAQLRDMLAGPQKHTLLYGGSRSGKTFLLCYAIATRALAAPGSRHAIFRRHGVAVKQSIGRDTFPKVMQLAYPGAPLKWHEQDGFFSMFDGSEVWLAGLDDKERVDKVLGKEFATVYFNEASEIPLSSYMVAQTRLAQKVAKRDGRDLPLRDYVDLNPTTAAHWTYKIFVEGLHPEGGPIKDRDNYAVGVANPEDNATNLPADYIEALRNLPERQRRRFYSGEFSADVENALWRRDYIKRAHRPAELQRIVVALDPAASSDAGSDETGIICIGVDAEGRGFVLEDESGRHRPEEWARRAISLYDQYGADRIIGEVNNGGDMIESVLRAQRPGIPYRAVRASRGKVTRAEPVAALYERGKISHCGEFEELEAQMCSFTLDFDRKAQGYSPDRVDALVWGLTDLFLDVTQQAPDLSRILHPGGRGWMAA